MRNPTPTTFTPSRMVRDLVAASRRPTSRRGPEVISLALGDPDFPTPEHISQALTDALASGETHYTQQQGDPELREALAEQLSEVANRDIRAQHVLMTHGGTAGLGAVILSTIDPGDRVVIPQPTYSLYSDLVRMAGGEVAYVGHRDDLHLDLDAIADAAHGARMLVICNPCNPTGAVFTEAELESLADIPDQHGLLVVSDEGYAHLVFDGVRFTSALEVDALADRLIYVQTFSKTFAMTGWRLGYVTGPPAVVEAATAVHRAFNGPLNTAVQKAGLLAVVEPGDEPTRMRREYQARRDIVARMGGGGGGRGA